MKLITGLISAVVALMFFNTQAATLMVSNTNDSGTGSLRQAIADNSTLGGGNTIIFSNGVNGTITLTNGELLLTSNATILGPGPGTLSVSGNAASRVFHITNGVTVAISGLTITNGAVSGSYPANLGGGIWNDHSTLTLSNCVVTGNSGGNGSGGGIYNDGLAGLVNLSIIASTISGNTSTGSGGGLANEGTSGGSATVLVSASTFSSNSAVGGGAVGGGIWSDGNLGGATLSISNSTFSGNSAASEGGGIYNGGASGVTLTVFTVRASTFSSNSAPGNGGAIFINGASSSSTIGGTILKAGASGANIVNNGGTFSSAGFNLSSDNANGLLTSATDQINTDPLLGPLANNGGPTFTCPLLPGSPAIDKGKSFSLTTDQRGQPRTFDFPAVTNATGGDGSDIGAFELGKPTLIIQKTGNNALLSWPAYYGTNFTLQSSTNILSSNSWTTAAGAAAVVGSQYQQTNGPLSTNRFFRLRGF
jgi:predicted outer membrane repeat protein